MKRRLQFWFIGCCLTGVAAVVIWRQWNPPALRDSFSAEALPLARAVDDPASKDADRVDWAGAADFKFTMGDGSGLHGYNVVQIGADGHCSYTFTEPIVATIAPGDLAGGVHGRRATFQLDAGTQARFRDLLRDLDFFRLKKEYHADVADGTQRWARVELSGFRKAVFCDNYFPPAFLRISRFVNDQIIAPNSAAIDEARAVAIEPNELDLGDNK